MEVLNKQRVVLLVKTGIVAAFGYFLWHEFAHADLNRIAALLSQTGLLLAFAVLPSAAMYAVDSYAWNLCFARSASRFPFHRAYIIRIATDAVHNSIPAGVALAETAKALIARNELGIPLTDGFAAGMIAKINTAAAQSLFIVIGLSVLAVNLSGGSQFSAGAGESMYVAAAFAIAAGVALAWRMYRGSAFGRVYAVLRRIPFKRFSAVLDTRKKAFVDLDHYISSFARHHARELYTSLALFFMGWMCAACETWIILDLLGNGANYLDALAIESAVSLLRIVFFFLPGGAGVQEAGIVALFASFGFADPVSLSAAFIIVRRAKELVWIAAGYGLFLPLGFDPFHPLLHTTQK